jgi:hypothetical protein
VTAGRHHRRGFDALTHHITVNARELRHHLAARATGYAAAALFLLFALTG